MSPLERRSSSRSTACCRRSSSSRGRRSVPGVGEPGRFDPRLRRPDRRPGARSPRARPSPARTRTRCTRTSSRPARPSEPLELAVERVRDGRSMSTRRVTVMQGDRTLLIVHGLVPRQPRPSPELARPAARRLRGPTSCRCCRTGCDELPPDAASRTRARWVDQPPPLELRIGEAPNVPRAVPPPTGRARTGCACRATSATTRCCTPRCSPTPATTCCSTWRSARTRSDAGPAGSTGVQPGPHALVPPPGALRPVAPPHSGDGGRLGRTAGLVRGAIHDEDGHLVASVMQEVLVRPRAEPRDRAVRQYVTADDADRTPPVPAAVARGRVPTLPARLRRRRPARRRARLGARLRRRALPRAPSASSTRARIAAPTSGVDVQVAVAQAGPVQIELIKQHCDRAERLPRLSASGGSGFHQLCTVTPDYDGKKAHYEQLGLRARERDGRARASTSRFFDTFDDFGFFTEVVEEVPGIPRAAWRRIAQTCAEWDGTRSRPHAHTRRLPHAVVTDRSITRRPAPGKERLDRLDRVGGVGGLVVAVAADAREPQRDAARVAASTPARRRARSRRPARGARTR